MEVIPDIKDKKLHLDLYAMSKTLRFSYCLTNFIYGYVG